MDRAAFLHANEAAFRLSGVALKVVILPSGD